MKRIVVSAIGAGLIAAFGLMSGISSVPVQAQGPSCAINSNTDGGTGAANANTVLILQPTVQAGIESDECSSVEATQAMALGYNVEIASNTQWGLKSAAQFGTYRALIFGDSPNNCNSVPLTGPITQAEANRTTWGPKVTGNVVVLGTDPAPSPAHGGDPAAADGAKLTRNGIKFAAALSGQTGAYIVLDCYYFGSTTPTAVPLLDPFGSFTVIQQDGGSDLAHIVDSTHPVVTDPNPLDDAALSGWSVSIHERFVTWPGSFTEVAEQVSDGKPYILARGVVSITATFTDSDTTEEFFRDPTNPSEVFARLTFDDVLTNFTIKFTFTTVSKTTESARLDPTVFGVGAECLSYDSDFENCVRHTVRLVHPTTGADMGVPVQGVHFAGNFRLELGFHDDNVSAGNIGTPILAQAIKHLPSEIESPIDLYDRDILTSFRYNSCDCVGVAETDGFSEFIMAHIPIPTGQRLTINGPLPPIQPDGSSVVKAGRALPVKFQAFDSSGNPVTSGFVAVLEVWKIADTVVGSTEIATDAKGDATGTTFTYNAASGHWELIADTTGWPQGSYVGIIRPVFVSPSNPSFPPVKFNFSVKK